MEITKGENANLAGMEPRCPKCGSKSLSLNFEKPITPQDDRDEVGPYVVCGGCGAKTFAENWMLADFAQFFRNPAPTPPLDVEARELEEAWSMLVERGVRIYTLSTALIDRDAYARTERAITQLLSLLRRHIASPAPQLKPLDRKMLEAVAEDGLLVSWDKDHKFSFSQVVRLMAEFAIEHIASPAQPEKRDALLGKVVRVENDRFNGFGYATHDSGPRKRVIGVMLENGNTWEYDAETVRSATPEEIKQAPRVVQAWAAPPQSGEEGQ